MAQDAPSHHETSAHAERAHYLLVVEALRELTLVLPQIAQPGTYVALPAWQQAQEIMAAATPLTEAQIDECKRLEAEWDRP